MKHEFLSAAATLAAVALQKKVESSEDITPLLMKSALLDAFQALKEAEEEWAKRNPARGMFL